MRRPVQLVRLLLLSAAMWSTTTAALHAQERRAPIGRFVADVRAAIPFFKEDVSIAAALNVDSTNLPTRGLGIAGGIHWYPARTSTMALGLGGEILLARASRTAELENSGPAGPTVNARLSSLSPQISLNFGSRRGWSYLTGGLGWAGFTTEREDDPVADATGRTRTINYGGGARWFAKEHVAFSLDLRFYRISAQTAARDRPAYPGMTLMVFSAGVSFK